MVSHGGATPAVCWNNLGDELRFIVLTRIAAVPTAVALVMGGVVPGAAFADPLPHSELVVSAAFDRPSYDSAEAVGATITIRNTGALVATGVKADVVRGVSTFRPREWDGLSPQGSGVRIEAGGTHVAHVTGFVDQSRITQLRFKGQVVSTPLDGTQADNTFDATTAVTWGKGSASYTVHVDANGNDQVDEGEGLGGVEASMSGAGRTFTGVTGPEGKVVFTDVPTGTYSSRFTSPDGWLVVDDPRIVIAPDQRVDSVRKAVRPLTDTLAATVEFDQDVYAADGTIGIEVTLTNTGDDLSAVRAWCGGPGDGTDLHNDTEGWGAFQEGAGGVALAAGETGVFHLFAPVPERASLRGSVATFCTFGDLAMSYPYNPTASDSARVLAPDA